MIAALPVYEVEDRYGRLVLEAEGYEATREAARFVLLAGEEAGRSSRSSASASSRTSSSSTAPSSGARARGSSGRSAKAVERA